jgi:hypothetical protein
MKCEPDPRWRKFPECRPGDGDVVLIATRYGSPSIHIGVFHDCGGSDSYFTHDHHEDKHVTHWMPLPDMPVEDP